MKQFISISFLITLLFGVYSCGGDSEDQPKSIAQLKEEFIDLRFGMFICYNIMSYGAEWGEASFPIDYFVMDGWFWRMGHHEVPFHEIRALIRELQPECLITDHTHLAAPYHMDIPYYEGPFGAFPVEGNIMPSALGHCSVKGNGWFWSPDSPEGMKNNDGVPVVLEKLIACEERYCNFLLNCMPNREGLLDPIYTEMLKEIGEQWSPDPNRPPLPDQGKQLAFSIPIQGVSASSGNAENLNDGTKIPGGRHHTWVSDSLFPQSIVVDLGEIQEVDVITLAPDQRVRPAPEEPLSEGNVTSCKVYASKDNEEFILVVEKSWEANALYRTIAFDLQAVRYLKIEILEANGPSAKITEIEVGLSD